MHKNFTASVDNSEYDLYLFYASVSLENLWRAMRADTATFSGLIGRIRIKIDIFRSGGNLHQGGNQTGRGRFAVRWWRWSEHSHYCWSLSTVAHVWVLARLVDHFGEHFGRPFGAGHHFKRFVEARIFQTTTTFGRRGRFRPHDVCTLWKGATE